MDGPRDPSPKASYEAAPVPPPAPFSDFREFYHTSLKVPAVDDSGNLNPALLWLGQYGYWAQSQKLGIRDTWGLFSPGHGRLQVAQAELFFTFLFMIVPICVGCNLVCIGVCIKMGWFAMPVALTAIYVGGLVAIWCIMLNAACHKPGYQWKDWKLRQD
ncbi:hypothetical protein BKA56DRAFT_572622 [Ilyonectria sp. MPI-CAGE-AT-0026]|nr:hypothetical protein BKA56DRAFT_572622 [Ilyonectria sp. MPI-CAGE-AT-0026]